MKNSINQNIFSSLDQYNKKIAIKDETLGEISYKKLNEDVEKLKKYFISKNLIMILSNNSYEFIVFYVASVKFNQLVLLVNPELANIEKFKILKKYKPDFIFTKNQINLKKKYHKILTFYNFILYKSNYNKKHKIKENLSCLLSTSGTTGDVKYAKLSRENILDNTKNISDVLKISSKDCSITTMPPYYSYALSIINTHLFKGASIVINNYSLIDRNFWLLFEKNRPNNINGVPYIYEILRKIKFDKFDISSLKYITQAGGKLDEVSKNYLINICNKKKIKFFIMYGQTEASPRISILPHQLLKKYPDSVGYVFKGSRVWLKNKFKFEGKIFGEIIYKGNNVFKGYSKSMKDLNNKDGIKKILNTGDVGYIDKNNLLYITSRKKRIIKIFGIRISLQNIEEELKKFNFTVVCKGNDKELVVLCKTKINKLVLLQKLKYITNLPNSCIKINYIKKIERNDIGKIIYK